MQRLHQEHLSSLIPLFEPIKDTLILSCLQGYMGNAWADSLHTPTFAVLQIGDFCFLSGDASSPKILPFLSELLTVAKRDSLLIITKDAAFDQILQSLYVDHFRSFKRYTLQTPLAFDQVMLKRIVSECPSHYALCRLEGDSYTKALQEDWSRDLVSNFLSQSDYEARGLGMVLLKEGQLVSGASSYSIYTGGIEIEIDTKESYRNQGLALIVGAALILAALENGLTPHWDAANETSVRLAKKLGYLYTGAYTTYQINQI